MIGSKEGNVDTSPGRRQLPTIEILGVKIHAVSMKSAVQVIEEFVEEGVPRLVITADSSGIVLAQSDQHWKDVLNSADLVTPDSNGVVWAARRHGTPLRERVSGVDLLDILCSRAAKKGYRVFLLGAAPGIAEKAAERLQARHPGLNVVGTHHGFFGTEEEAAIVAQIRDLQVDLLFVAMGIPRQEMFIYDHKYEMAAKVAMGVGGSLDVWSGTVKRAPRLVRALKLEWLWRLILNPRKWKKALTLPKFWWLVMTRVRRSPD
ncbi:MAG: N-acetylmannosaminyltransferase [Fimbriimonadales bacterium]|nr:MAG: N-acetylmannosaminyltransferase [Fimbriimonadales bacterium]